MPKARGRLTLARQEPAMHLTFNGNAGLSIDQRATRATGSARPRKAACSWEEESARSAGREPGRSLTPRSDWLVLESTGIRVQTPDGAWHRRERRRASRPGGVDAGEEYPGHHHKLLIHLFKREERCLPRAKVSCVFTCERSASSCHPCGYSRPED
ncbi:hypothetical protein BDY17DRAFT_161400 [Neohortaea acidophila]|uniref:Uncharacterized protein n=1 Tax=Neohortaea acidophila TaxID=245834 RepID=A0A6A6PQZ7_9PEZI|nr:uncharacterized protein BDY17DRAFT_161400 [Neohortaea acidophila]KAF2482520.1 hypothetical protein BDY17DRAFT_161400 [Neohortaea acidophila]